MKKIIYIISALFFISTAKAQLTSTLVISSKPSASIYNWSLNRGFVTYIISNTSQTAVIGKLSVKLKTATGEVIGSINPSAFKPISFAPGNTILQTADVLAGDAWLLNGAANAAVLRNNKLASGTYQLCVSVTEILQPIPITPEQCRILLVQNAQLPFLIMPADKQELDVMKAQTAIIFRWTPLSPLLQGATGGTRAVVYRIQVFEVYSHQQDVQALRSNQPLLDELVRGTTQYIWRPQIAMALDSPSRFVWTIQTLDDAGNPADTNGNGEARSEPKVFIVKKNPILNRKTKKGKEIKVVQ